MDALTMIAGAVKAKENCYYYFKKAVDEANSPHGIMFKRSQDSFKARSG